MPKVVGLIPAAGRAKRLTLLPGSKELFPIGFYNATLGGRVCLRPKVVSHYLLEAMVLAGVTKVYMILSKEKCDILRYYGDGAEFGAPIAYLVIDHFSGMPYTLNQAQPWLMDDTVIFGMPDTLFTPTDVFVDLLKRHSATRDDLTIGLFPTSNPQRFGMVALAAGDRVLKVIDKPAQTNLTHMWGMACWSPCFTHFMGEYLQKIPPPSEREVVLGDVFQAAVDEGLNVGAVRFDDGQYIDVGIPEDLRYAIQRFSGQAVSE